MSDADRPVRMPNGVMGYLTNGTTDAEVAAAEARAIAGDSRSYESALLHHLDPDRPSAVKMTGRPFMTILAEALAETPEGTG